MEELRLVRVREGDAAFQQYLPENFRPMLGWEETVCVGAVYRGMACGAALAERTAPEEYYLRYIFVDPGARLCGLGTYLLLGLLGQLEEAGARQVQAVYAPSMLEGGRQTLGILERAGFSPPKPVSTAFSSPLGDILGPEVPLPEGMTIYTAQELPEPLLDAYDEMAQSGELPAYADAEEAVFPSAELSTFCVVDGVLAGVMLIDRQESALVVAGLFVREQFRRGHTAAALIDRSLREAQKRFPPETEVCVSAINREAFALCDRLLRRSGAARKETELLSVYQFPPRTAAKR